jgi:hypothetical protein
MKRKITAAALALTMIFAILPVLAPALRAQGGFTNPAIYVTTANLNLRTAPSTEAPSLGVVWDGTGVQLLEVINNDWYRVTTINATTIHDVWLGNATGYMAREFLRLVQPGAHITDFGRQVAEDFLMQRPSLFGMDIDVGAQFATSFSLFDLDGSGIPDILINYDAPAGFRMLYRFIDGEYRPAGDPVNGVPMGSLWTNELGQIVSTEWNFTNVRITNVTLTPGGASFSTHTDWTEVSQLPWYGAWIADMVRIYPFTALEDIIAASAAHRLVHGGAAPITDPDFFLDGQYIITLTPPQQLFTPLLGSLDNIANPAAAQAQIRSVAQGLTPAQRASGDALNIAALYIENIARRGTTQNLPFGGIIGMDALGRGADASRQIHGALEGENIALMRNLRRNINFVSQEAGQLAASFPGNIMGEAAFDNITIEADFAAVTLNRQHIPAGGSVAVSAAGAGLGGTHGDFLARLAARLSDTAPLSMIFNFWALLFIVVLAAVWLILSRLGKNLRLWVVPTFAILALAGNAAMILWLGDDAVMGNAGRPAPTHMQDSAPPNFDTVEVAMTDGMRATLSIPAGNLPNPHNWILFDSQNRPAITKFNPVTGNIDAQISESGIYVLRSYETSFADIGDMPQLMQDAIVRLASRGIMGGTADGYFDPRGPIARGDFANAVGAIFGMEHMNIEFLEYLPKEELAVMTANALTEHMGYYLPPNIDAILGIYLDRDQLPAWSEEGIALATAANVLILRSDGLFAPHSVMTRGDAAVVLYRLFGRAW